MLLDRSQATIGVVFVALLFVGTVYAVFASGGAFRPGMTLTAEFADAAGLKEGSFVFLSGVRTGRVSGVELADGVVLVDFTVQAPELPDDSSAEIILQSTLGKRAIRLVPGDSDVNFEAGGIIPVDRTTGPVDLPELGDETVELLGETDVDAFDQLVAAVADITEGQREEVADLLDGLQQVTGTVADKKGELARVVDATETVIDAAADSDEEIVRIIDGFGATLADLVDRRDDITRTLRETAGFTSTASDLLRDRRAQIDRILFELHEDLQIFDRHQVELAHAFAYIGVALDGFASTGYQQGPRKADNPTWGNVFTTNIGAVGIEAGLACGGAFDEFLTQVIGPDPQCEGAPERPGGAPDGDGGGEASGAAAPATRGGVDGFFALAGN